MHLADGVLGLPTLVGSAILATAGIAIGLRKLTPRSLPSAALFAAVFFIVGTIHIPIGIGSAADSDWDMNSSDDEEYGGEESRTRQ